MNKRNFLLTSGLTGLLPATGSLAQTAALQQPGLLTVSGAIGNANRGPFDPVIDQMMHKHGIQFAKAHQFDAAGFQRLPFVTIKPTLEYDGKQHTLQGPLLATVLEAAGGPRNGSTRLGLRAVDGYNVTITVADASAYRMIVATQIDGRPMAIGGFGPQWAVFDADSVAAFKDKPLNERFAMCPWGLYHIDISAG